MADKEPTLPASANMTPEAKSSATPDSVVPPNWGPNTLIYSDVSRMLFRMHRNVAAHMDANKRLAERMQAVFSHEQAMVLELARLIDESLALTQRKASEDKPAGDSIEKIFDHASNAMKETGRMLTEIQLEALSLLEHYIKDAVEGGAKSLPKPEEKKETGKE